MIEISEIKTYPVKSLQEISLQEAMITVRGLEFDRNWMITDSKYKFITQRQLPALAAIHVSLKEDILILEAKKISSFIINPPTDKSNFIDTVIWKDKCKGIDEGADISKWLTDVLGKWNGDQLKLVRFVKDFKRPVDPNYLKGEKAHTAFTDGFPFLITSEESLQLLNKKLVENNAKEIPMNRFRPNIVIKGEQPFAENDFDTLYAQSGEYSFGIRKPCQRCKTTIVDQKTGIVENPKKPLSTLIRMNPFPDLKGAFFGQNATLLNGDGELISVGDQLNFTKKQK